MNENKVYLLLAEGFEETEAICPLDLMRRAGIPVYTVALGDDRIVRSGKGIAICADLCFDELPQEPPRAVILPGGMPGAKNLNVVKVHRLLNACAQAQGVLGAICAAPMVLGSAGLLQGRKATCFPGFEEYLTGARLCRQPVVRDGNVITGASMGAASAFGFALIGALAGEKAAQKVQKDVSPYGG